jgi:3-hydroxyacyl-[acyl-carrier-protein] dehydratase
VSKLNRAIKGCMRDFVSEPAGTMKARFSFPADFIGFAGHFPGKPVLPGVCKIQAMLCMLEAAYQRTPKLKEIALAKFFAPVTCNEEIVFTVHQLPEGSDEALAKAFITHKDKKIAEIHVRVVFEP